MMLLLAMLTTLGVQDEDAIREHVESTIRTQFEAEDLRKLAGMKGAVGVIMKMLQEDERKLMPLVYILGQIKANEAEGFILGLLKHQSPAVRVNAAGALVSLGCTKATEDISALLRDPAIIEADKAIVAAHLGDLGETKALQPLREYRDDLRRRNVQLGGPNLNTKLAITKLEAIALPDPVQKEKRLTDLLMEKHDNSETLKLRAWAAEKLADLQCKNAAATIRAMLPEIAGDGEAKAKLLKSLKRLGGQLTSKEQETLQLHGINP